MSKSSALVAVISCLLALSTFAASAQQQWPALTLNDQTVGGLRSHKAGALRLPKGTAPFAAVVILPGCNGVKHETRVWAHRIASWGYAALIVDSFRPRGIKNVCHRGGELPADERAKDAFAAAAYLRTRPDIDPERIGLLGYSHGGWTALAAATQPLVIANGGKAFPAVVAYYPICKPDTPALASDLQILIGGADDWSSPKACGDLVARYADAPAHKPLLKIYPGATHSFDVDRPDRIYLGHRLAYDARAATDSFDMTKKFLDSRLRGEKTQ
jgi:dienelactone hydrolase